MIALPTTLGVGLRLDWIIDDNQIGTPAGDCTMDANREVFTAVACRPGIGSALIPRNTEPKVLLLSQDERSDALAEMFCQAK
jgi:hypothetical protein